MERRLLHLAESDLLQAGQGCWVGSSCFHFRDNSRRDRQCPFMLMNLHFTSETLL